MKELRVLAIIFFAFTTVAVAQERKIDPAEHRAQIRASLLKETPIGCTLGDVQHFIAANLRAKPLVVDHGATGDAAAHAPNRGVKSIRVPLGTYFDNVGTIFLTAPLVNSKEATAQWAFDEHDRLVDVFVDKTLATY